MISKIKGVIQNYAWGGRSYIAKTLGVKNEEQKPMAEYWLGAHPKAPSQLENGKLLNELIDANPAEMLGEKKASEFDQRLPFLLKILDVKNTLSIQVHPSKIEAEKGFAKENELGIALTAPNRNFKDDNHKPEIMIALSDFWLLHGFKSPEAIREIFGNYNSLKEFAAELDNKGLKQFYKDFMAAPADLIEGQMKALIDEISASSPDKSSPDYWALKYFREENLYDRGLLSIYMMNLVFIKQGDGIFQAAGIPHAYLEGQNIELMANSDNVLRGGLTPKHVDIDELLKHTSFETVTPKVMQASDLPVHHHERAFAAPIPDFLLTQIELKAGETYTQDGSNEFEILLLVDNKTINIDGNNAQFSLSKGDACAVSYHSPYTIEAPDGCVLYKATLPS
ncbi:MAG: mannose-6-phosphate isomerase, class I [Cytophagales bacterium]|nr:mannose-6-phosphate isomerase, class I [Cytophagales bacterium]